MSFECLSIKMIMLNLFVIVTTHIAMKIDFQKRIKTASRKKL